MTHQQNFSQSAHRAIQIPGENSRDLAEKKILDQTKALQKKFFFLEREIPTPKGVEEKRSSRQSHASYEADLSNAILRVLKSCDCKFNDAVYLIQSVLGDGEIAFVRPSSKESVAYLTTIKYCMHRLGLQEKGARRVKGKKPVGSSKGSRKATASRGSKQRARS